MGTVENQTHCCECEKSKLRSLNSYRQNMMVIFYAPLATTALIGICLLIAILVKLGKA